MPSPETGFQESNLRTTSFRDLGLRIEGTRLEPIVEVFKRELQGVEITRLRPRFYLSTEWGVPFGTIAIAIPFYLARPDLEELQAEQIGHIEGVDATDILRYFRHEMGHVVNYAYRLYEQPDWVKLFGSITQPYHEEYHPQPFSRRFVRHLPGWYAQKHPDEDWAETFAVWMTPNADWRKSYAAWPTALAKLNYCDQLMGTLKDVDPPVQADELDEDVGELSYSLQEHYRHITPGNEEFPPGLEGALTAIFEDFGQPEQGSANTPRKPASELIHRIERELIANVFRWTGHFPERTRPLLRHLADQADALKQVYPADRESQMTIALTTFVTALAMNHVHRGSYLP
jgi:hypothetical protein